MLAKTY